MKLYKFELMVWLMFASAVVTMSTIAAIWTGNAFCFLAIAFAFMWDFNDVKMIRNAELLIEARKADKGL